MPCLYDESPLLYWLSNTKRSSLNHVHTKKKTGLSKFMYTFVQIHTHTTTPSHVYVCVTTIKEKEAIDLERGDGRRWSAGTWLGGPEGRRK